MKLSANLGYLWAELELPDAIRAAADAGFDAIEVHWPYIVHALEVAMVLEETGLGLVSLNTVAGDLGQGDFGLAALPGRQVEARAAIDKALAYATDCSAANIHVLAGLASGDEAGEAFVENLRFAAMRGEEFGVGILIEPFSIRSRPGYFLTSVSQAADIVSEVACSNVKILMDCFHTRLDDVDLLETYSAYQDLIGHIQFSSVPNRRAPGVEDDFDFAPVFRQMTSLGYEGFFAAEYHPITNTADSLGWIPHYR